MDSNQPARPDPVTPSIDPYAPPAVAVEAPHYDLGNQKPLAGRGARLGAQLLNGLTTIPGIILFAVGMNGADPETGAPTGMGIVFWVVAGLYFLFLLIVNLRLIAREGQSLGKKWANVRVVRTDGSRASLGRLVGLRYIVNSMIGSIPIIGPVYALVDIGFIFREDRRTIHDMIADTKVVEA